MDTVVTGFRRPAEGELPFADCADDLMLGAEPIASFVSDLVSEEVSPKRIYQWVDRGLLPVGHFGGRLFGSKRTIAAHFAAIATGKSTNRDPVTE